MVQHTVRVAVQTRDLPPVDGWRAVERTGQARTTCPCGLDTGLVPTTEAITTARTHGGR